MFQIDFIYYKIIMVTKLLRSDLKIVTQNRFPNVHFAMQVLLKIFFKGERWKLNNLNGTPFLLLQTNYFKVIYHKSTLPRISVSVKYSLFSFLFHFLSGIEVERKVWYESWSKLKLTWLSIWNHMTRAGPNLGERKSLEECL